MSEWVVDNFFKKLQQMWITTHNNFHVCTLLLSSINLHLPQKPIFVGLYVTDRVTRSNRQRTQIAFQVQKLQTEEAIKHCWLNRTNSLPRGLILASRLLVAESPPSCWLSGASTSSKQSFKMVIGLEEKPTHLHFNLRSYFNFIRFVRSQIFMKMLESRL